MVRTLADKHPINWSPEHPASPAVLDSLFDDLGIGMSGTLTDNKAREATRAYCTEAMSEAAHIGTNLRIGHIERLALAFYAGYMACWAKNQAHI